MRALLSTEPVTIILPSLLKAKQVIQSEDKTARIWDVITGQQRFVLRGHTDWITCLALSSDGKMIITGSLDKTARIWDVATSQQRFVLDGHMDAIWCYPKNQ